MSEAPRDGREKRQAAPAPVEVTLPGAERVIAGVIGGDRALI